MEKLENYWKKWSIPIKRKKYIYFLSLFLIFSLVFFVMGILLNDSNIDDEMYSSNPFIFWLFRIIAEMGSIPGFLFSFCVIYIYFDLKLGRSALFSYMIAVVITTIMKIIVQDLRPPENIYHGVPLGIGWGFPSSISAGLICFWGYIIFHANKIPNQKMRHILDWIAIILCIIIPFSHLIIGMSDLEDILGGYLVGFPILAVFILIDAHLAKMKVKSLTIFLLGLLFATFYAVAGYLVFQFIFPDSKSEIIESLSIPSGLILGLTSIYSIINHFKPINLQKFPPKPRNIVASATITVIIAVFIGFQVISAIITIPVIIWSLTTVLLHLITMIPLIVFNFLERKRIPASSAELGGH